MISNEKLAQNATFICGHRKTGTTLLVALLDNHPEVMTIPSDSGFFYGYYPLYENTTYSIDEKKQRILEICIRPFKELIDSLEGSRKIYFAIQDMEQAFLNNCKQSNGETKNLLIAMAMAYRDASPLDKTCHKRWIEKTTSTEIYAADIKKWFPKAKFIHLIRDPRDNFGSLKSGWEKRYKQFNDRIERLLQSHIERGKLGMELARWNKERFGKEEYLVVKYEDLTENPERVMREIANFLNISFLETLLKPTIWGIPWPGNNFDGIKFKGVSKVNVNRWRERITPEEASVIEFYFSDIMEFFGYKREFSKSEQIDAARNLYSWHNYAQIYSVER